MKKGELELNELTFSGGCGGGRGSCTWDSGGRGDAAAPASSMRASGVGAARKEEKDLAICSGVHTPALFVDLHTGPCFPPEFVSL
jgi:hypothetical protein